MQGGTGKTVTEMGVNGMKKRGAIGSNATLAF